MEDLTADLSSSGCRALPARTDVRTGPSLMTHISLPGPPPSPPIIHSPVYFAHFIVAGQRNVCVPEREGSNAWCEQGQRRGVGLARTKRWTNAPPLLDTVSTRAVNSLGRNGSVGAYQINGGVLHGSKSRV